MGKPPTLTILLSIAALALIPPAGAQSAPEPLEMWLLPALVLENDTAAAISAESTAVALHTYRATVAQALPQIDLSSSYSLAYTPESTTVTETVEDRGTNLVAARLSLSQLLPTAGSVSLSVEDTMTVATAGSRTAGGTTTSPEPGFAQAPRLTLGFTQPLFVNRKLIDLDLFSATLRKAELGYLGQSLANTAQRNRSVYQAAELYLSVVGFRKNVTQIERAIEVAQQNLEALVTSFELGSVTEADLLDARIGLSRQRQTLLELRSTLARAERLLGHSLGSEGISGRRLNDFIPELAFPLSREETAARALEAHPILRQRMLEAEETKVNGIIAGQQYAASLGLNFSVAPRYPFDASRVPYTTETLSDSVSDLFGEGSGQDYSFSATLTLHLFDGGRQREGRAGSTALAAAAEQAVVAQRQSILDQVELGLMQKTSLEEKIALLGESVELARLRLATEERLRSLGQATDLDVAAKQTDLEARGNDLWRARADLFLTILDLRSLTGDELDAAIEGTRP